MLNRQGPLVVLPDELLHLVEHDERAGKTRGRRRDEPEHVLHHVEEFLVGDVGPPSRELRTQPLRELLRGRGQLWGGVDDRTVKQRRDVQVAQLTPEVVPGRGEVPGNDVVDALIAKPQRALRG